MAFNMFETQDPLHLFEVGEDKCQLLTVTVYRGRDVTQGRIADALDTPDPYVTLSISTSPEKTQATSVVDDDPNPVWNQTFTFHLDPRENNVLEVALKESDIVVDDLLHSKSISINKLPKDRTKQLTLKMGKKTEIDLELHLMHNVPSDLQYSSSLCVEEQVFLKKRKEKVLAAMKEAFGDEGPNTEDEVPVVGVLGSGGGFRAMIGFSGVVSGLEQAGLMDMSCYMAGLSGSSWLMAHLFSHPKWPASKSDDLIDDLRESAGEKGIMSVLNPIWMARIKKRVKEKEIQGQTANIVDYFGHALKERLLKERLDSKLSDQKDKMAEANLPLPLYTCISVQDTVQAKKWHEWLEFSPYGITLAKYGIFMPPHLFGNKFFMGRSYVSYPEEPLHYFMGLWGSAFSILLSRVLFASDEKKEDQTEHDIQNTLDEDLHGTGDSPPMTQDNYPVLEDDGLIVNDDQPTSEEPGLFKRIVSQSSLLGSRTGQAAVIPNILSRLSMVNKKPLATLDFTRASLISTFRGVFESHSRTQPTMTLGDAGIAFNLPFPIFLRPQRGVDIILSFDFSLSQSDPSQAFAELKLAELWARKHKVLFPKIDENIIHKEGLKECYIFQDKNPRCPVVIHFLAYNINFRKEKAPGVPRETKEEKKFGDFNVFEGGKYGTLRFNYSEDDFNKLRLLMAYNTLLCADTIKQKILERVVIKHTLKENTNWSESVTNTLSEKWEGFKQGVIHKALDD